MKKIVLLSFTIAAIGLTSCKKSYSCSCTSKVSGGGSSVETKYSENYSEKMKEKQAKSACSSTQKTLDNQVKKDYDGQGAEITVACEVK